MLTGRYDLVLVSSSLVLTENGTVVDPHVRMWRKRRSQIVLIPDNELRDLVRYIPRQATTNTHRGQPADVSHCLVVEEHSDIDDFVEEFTCDGPERISQS